MKLKLGKKKIVITVAALLIVASMIHFIFLRIDYIRIRDGRKPMFSVVDYAVDDGGSIGYVGFGYKIEYIHSFCYREINKKAVRGLKIGVRVDGRPGLHALDKLIVKNEEKIVLRHSGL